MRLVTEELHAKEEENRILLIKNQELEVANQTFESVADFFERKDQGDLHRTSVKTVDSNSSTQFGKNNEKLKEFEDKLKKLEEELNIEKAQKANILLELDQQK